MMEEPLMLEVMVETVLDTEVFGLEVVDLMGGMSCCLYLSISFP